jgi:hypothetical protein
MVTLSGAAREAVLAGSSTARLVDRGLTWIVMKDHSDALCAVG